jgi:PD-(D/E)XK nuclease superfamily protein
MFRGSAVGRVSETGVLNKLVHLGLEVLIPWSNHLPYDIAYYVEDQRQLVRIQVKTAKLSKDSCSFTFSTIASYYNRKQVTRSSYDQRAEYIAAYLREGGRVFMLAVNEAPKHDVTMYFRDCVMNSGKYDVRKIVFWAEDYEI